MHHLRPSSPRRGILDFKKDGNENNILNLIFTYTVQRIHLDSKKTGDKTFNS